jgi:hypothetical protein
MTSINAASRDVWLPPLTSTRNWTMSSKGQIPDRLGGGAVCLPELIGAGLAAKERGKLRLTMLQKALVRALNVGGGAAQSIGRSRQAGLDHPRSDDVVAGRSGRLNSDSRQQTFA